MNVAIIGGAGRMGRWLISHFLNQGHEVVISDIKMDEARAIAKSTGVRLAKDNIEAVKDADLTVISTPIEITPNVLLEISSKLRKSTIVLEISSLKAQIIPVLEKMAKRGVRALSIHPLFGPGVQKLAEKKMALIPVLDPSSETRLARELFPDAKMIVIDAEEHDRAMALTLSLPHFMNIIFASIIGEEDLNLLKKLSGTTFTLQLTISEGVMAEDPTLYSSIQMNNKYTVQYLERLTSRAETLKGYVAKEDRENFVQFYKDAQNAISKDTEFHKAYERMYKALEAF